ncbi:MAG: hypothetical protein L0H93_07845, partial [Nocardioides sp.]|nr:hypothetical protein [Nocardioides sp.]
MIGALTPRRWATIRAMLDLLTVTDAPVTLNDLAATCPPRLEYLPCHGHHEPGRGMIALDCDGETHRVVRDSDTITIQPEVDLFRELGWVELLPRATVTRSGGRASLYAYTGPTETVADLMGATFRWQPPRRPKGCPDGDDTYLDFHPDPAQEA